MLNRLVELVKEGEEEHLFSSCFHLHTVPAFREEEQKKKLIYSY